MTAAAIPTATLDEVRTRLLVGAPPGRRDHLPPRVRRGLELAEAVGAPALPALDAAVAALTDVRRQERAVAVATAQARIVAAGLVALPVVAVPALDRLFGLPLLAFYATPVGRLVGAGGGLLVLLGAGISWRLVRSAARPSAAVGGGVPPAVAALGAGLLGIVIGGAELGAAAAIVVALIAERRRRAQADQVLGPGGDEIADLIATALGAGLAVSAALRVVADVLPQHAPRLRRMATGIELGHEQPGPLERIRNVLAAATDWGAPAAPGLRRLAHELRADELARSLAAAERLPALLTFPTATCLLPASVVLIGAPMIALGVATAAGT